MLVDPKGTDYAVYRGANLLKPNRRELAEATRRPVGSDMEYRHGRAVLIEQHALGAVLVSLSEQGMLLVEASGATHRLPTVAREVFDVSGAGDTVMAVMAAALAVGASALEAARLANIAAGIVVGKIGTAAVHARELLETLIDRDQAQARKIAAAAVGARSGRALAQERAQDRLHQRRVRPVASRPYLAVTASAAACDRLIVGLNSDASTAPAQGTGPAGQSRKRARRGAGVGRRGRSRRRVRGRHAAVAHRPRSSRTCW